MSEPKLISPLLDGFLIGSPMSDHNGVCCCPAMKENSDHKYIVKVISIPASQNQLDALLLAGAYKDPADAMDYFKELCDGVVKDAEFLKEMSRLDGFLGYEAWQVVPMEDNRLGYQVYLLGSYKRSLEKHMRRTMLTHLDAVNLGIDICSALATARRAGSIYLDLKPSNIFLSEEKSYRIGDLGFAAMDSFRYTSLPGKYVSQYAPPELRDPMSTLNETVDTYALGMVLYRIYNDGNLPPVPEDLTQPYPTPVNADYELAEIILKALSPKPEDRWKDPTEMGQALVSYMQRNEVNDTPVTPPSTVISHPEDIVKPEEPAEGEEASAVDETAPTAEDAPDLAAVAVTEEVSDMVAQADDLLSHEIPDSTVTVTESPQTEEAPAEEARPAVPAPEAQPPRKPEPRRPRKPEPPKRPEPPKPVKAPPQEPTEPEDPFKHFDPDDDEEDMDELVLEPQSPAPEAAPAAPRVRKRRKHISKAVTGFLITLVILGLLGAGGYYFYENYYLQTIDSITIDGTQSALTVTVDTDLDESKLTVVCIDTYGNAQYQPLKGGQAVFTDLLSDSLYRIQLEVDGFYKLVGKTSDIFTTESQTVLVSFSTVTGAEDGSVMLNFTIDGPEPDGWTLVYGVEGEEPHSETFGGHAVTVRELEVGKVYHFHLEDQNGNVIVAENETMTFTASQLITAENLSITAEGADSLVVTWDTPEGADVNSWAVRCYNDEDYDQQMTSMENTATFTGVDASKSYTVEVTAEGMTQPARASITANPITITALSVNEDDPMALTVSWEFQGSTPGDGWLLMYSVDGSDAQNVVTCDGPTGVITPRIPGAEYTFTIQAANGISIFDNVRSYETPEAEPFNSQSLSAGNVSAVLVKTPNDPNWNASNVTKNDYRDSFVLGEPVSVILHANRNFFIPEEEISVLYVFRDSEGRVLPKLTARETINWKNFWVEADYHDGELDLALVPSDPGAYSVSIYFDGAFMASADFSITSE